MTAAEKTDGLNRLLHWYHAKIVRKARNKKLVALFEASIIGSIAALCAYVFVVGVAAMMSFRTYLTTILPAIIVFPFMGLLGGAICGLAIQFIAPEITGSGIPQVKAALNKIPMKLDFRVALTKLVSGIVALGIGLPLGREGPTVQVGAAAAAILDRLGMRSFRNRRQLIAAGAGAGLAAAFNAPLAGLIFVLEELLREISGATVTIALLACFFAGIVSRWMGNHSLDLQANSQFPKAVFTGQDIPFCLLLGIAAGLIGVLFNKGVLSGTKLNKMMFGKNYGVRVALAGFICGLVIALLPDSFRDFAGVRQLLLEGRGLNFALVVFLANFALTLVAYGSGAPGGLFAPALTIGAAIGYFVGSAETLVYPLATHAPLTLALAGMGAFFAAVARVPVTAAVIVFEITADFNLLLPLMISSITAYFIGESLFPGSVYDRLLELDDIHLPENAGSSPLDLLTVGECMQQNVVTLNSDMTHDEAVHFIKDFVHKGFPVLKEGVLVGVLTKNDLLERNRSTVEEIMTPNPISVDRDALLIQAISLMDAEAINRIPVTSGAKLTGIITRADIIRALSEL
ncbi:MAG: chloride channel protein [Cyanobacteria bacterium SZAS-4]|nr:chloride channel protein [Cyanobacteria bacterium SZAS-4]